MKGLLQLEGSVEVYYFRFMAEREAVDADEDDVRIFGLYIVAVNVLEEFLAKLSPYQEPKWPIWVPLWKFPTSEILSRMDALVSSIEGDAGPLVWIIATTNAFESIRAFGVTAKSTAA